MFNNTSYQNIRFVVIISTVVFIVIAKIADESGLNLAARELPPVRLKALNFCINGE